MTLRKNTAITDPLTLLTPEEFLVLDQAMTPRYRPLIEFSVSTGRVG